MGNEESVPYDTEQDDYVVEPPSPEGSEKEPTEPTHEGKKAKTVKINLVPTVFDNNNRDLNRAGGWGRLTKLYNSPKAKAFLAFKEAAHRQNDKRLSVPSMRYDTLNYGKWEPNGSAWSSDPRDWGYETIPANYPIVYEHIQHPNAPDDMTPEAELPTKYESLDELYKNHSEWKMRFRKAAKNSIHIHTRSVNDRGRYRAMTKKPVIEGEWANY